MLIVASAFFVYTRIPNDIIEYQTKMDAFVANESMALEVYGMPPNTPEEDVLSEIKNRGIYYWQENINLITNLDKLNLPVQIHDRNKILLHYCDLRIKSYDLLYKTISQKTKEYRVDIEAYNKEIMIIIDSLKKP